MNTPLYVFENPIPEGMRNPVLVVCLEGWIDAGYGAAAAVGHLKAQIRTQRLIGFDTDELVDQRARRPVMRLINGVNESLRWPRLQIRHGRDSLGQDLLVMTGPEPDFRWRAFTRAVMELVDRFDVRLCVLFGAFPAPTPHTRPLQMAATATTSELAARVGFTEAAFEIPAGAQAAIERAFAEAGRPAVGVWARVPHYAATMPFPSSSASILDTLASLTGLVIDTADLHTRGRIALQQIDSLIAGNPEHVEMVRNLEAQFDAEAAQKAQADAAAAALANEADLPTGDELAAELEKFLRDQ